MTERGKPICIVSPHEKGFWQADVYNEGWAEGVPPDWVRTGKLGGKRSELIDAVLERFPGIEVIDGVTGICPECSEEYFNLEEECIDCECFLLT
jgi:hypothetical protein